MLVDSHVTFALVIKLREVHCGGCHVLMLFERVTTEPQVERPNIVRYGLVVQLVKSTWHERVVLNPVEGEDLLFTCYNLPNQNLQIRLVSCRG